MRLLVNTASAWKGGSVQVATSFLRECLHFEEHSFGVVLGPGLSQSIRAEEFPNNFEFFRLPYRPAQKVLSLQRPARELIRIESAVGPDAVFTTSGPSYWRPKAPHLMGFNLPHHVYPDSPYFSEVLTVRQRLRWWLKSRLIHYYTRGFADAWVVQTDDVNERLRRWIPSDKVFTVPNTISSSYLSPNPTGTSGAAEVSEVRTDFRLLVLTSYYPHKNLEILNDIVSRLRDRSIKDISFTMTLPESDFERTIRTENRPWVRNLGPQAPEDCPKLYRQSDAVFLPTLLECFSANYVEAMAMQRPILTTDLGFAHTVCRDAATYFEPLSGANALEKILELRHDPHLRRRLVDSGRQELGRFDSAAGRASAYLDLCQRLIDRFRDGG